MKITKAIIREHLQIILNHLDVINDETEFLENQLVENINGDLESSMYELFDGIRQNQWHDLDEIMGQMEDLGLLKNLPERKDPLDPETIENFRKRQEAKVLIKRAIALGILQAAGSERVYVCITDDGANDDENCYWMPFLLDDAASNLVESGNVETLLKAVEEKEKANNG